MNIINIDKEWTFRRGFLDSLGMMETDPGVIVNLPHDGMISTEVSPDAPAGVDSGYFTGGMSNYTKYIFIPKEWENECVGLRFDGVMQCASVEVNGSKAAYQHNGYIPFYVDLTNYVTFGSENRITINVNTSMQPNSRWYTGSGLYRGASLCHGPRVHIVTDGIFISTKEVADGYAFLSAQVEVENMTTENRVAEVSLFLYPEGSDECVAETKQRVHIGAVKRAVARLSMNVKNPSLWDADNPNLYRVKAVVKDMGVYRTHLIKNDVASEDEAETLFGIRTITADAVRGLRINGKSVKLKGTDIATKGDLNLYTGAWGNFTNATEFDVAPLPTAISVDSAPTAYPGIDGVDEDGLDKTIDVMLIPGASSKITGIEIVYYVCTQDLQLDGGVVENKISKVLDIDPSTDGNQPLAIEKGKQYGLNLLLGLTSIDLTATVEAWDEITPATDVDLPKNVD